MTGIALGEAAGMQVDGWTAGSIRKRIGRVRSLDPRDVPAFLRGCVRRGEKPKKVARQAGMYRPPGLYFNLAQQALLVAEGVALEGEAGCDRFAREAARFAQPSRRGKLGRHRNPSPSFREAVTRVLHGADWREAGDDTSFAESAVRCLPAGLFRCDDPGRAAADAARLASFTDLDPDGVSPAVAAALFAALLSGRGTNAEPRATLAELRSLLERTVPAVAGELEGRIDFEPEDLTRFAGLLQAMEPYLSLPGGEEEDEAALEAIARLTQERYPGPKPLVSGEAPGAVAAAVHLALTEFEGPARTILRAANLGGKTSALCALAGGFAGARFGAREFPREWSETLWNRTAIRRLAELLARPDATPRWAGNLYEIEEEINERYRQAREDLRREILSLQDPDRR